MKITHPLLDKSGRPLLIEENFKKSPLACPSSGGRGVNPPDPILLVRQLMDRSWRTKEQKNAISVD
jgi:hypothetical protein